jgi:hypothetical protein
MSLAEYYKINWRLSYSYKYSLSELESMIPFERDIYLFMTAEELKREKEELEKRNNARR